MPSPSERPTELILLGGWAHTEAIWGEVGQFTNREYRIKYVDLPGYSSNWPLGPQLYDEENLTRALLELIPPGAVLCGWSLGGMLASRIARLARGRVRALITICSNPLFVASRDWRHAMQPDVFAEFKENFEREPEATVAFFRGLCAQGSVSPKRDMRELKRLTDRANPIPVKWLKCSLNVLEGLDVRNDIRTYTGPQLHLLGEHDALVPQGVTQSIQELNSSAKIQVLKRSSHLPMISAPSLLYSKIFNWLISDVSDNVEYA